MKLFGIQFPIQKEELDLQSIQNSKLNSAITPIVEVFDVKSPKSQISLLAKNSIRNQPTGYNSQRAAGYKKQDRSIPLNRIKGFGLVPYINKVREPIGNVNHRWNNMMADHKEIEVKSTKRTISFNDKITYHTIKSINELEAMFAESSSKDCEDNREKLINDIRILDRALDEIGESVQKIADENQKFNVPVRNISPIPTITKERGILQLTLESKLQPDINSKSDDPASQLETLFLKTENSQSKSTPTLQQTQQTEKPADTRKPLSWWKKLLRIFKKPKITPL